MRAFGWNVTALGSTESTFPEMTLKLPGTSLDSPLKSKRQNAAPSTGWETTATSSTLLLLVGAMAMGATGGGIWGMAPAYLTERFPTAVRGVGPGLSYHVGAAVGSVTPLMLGQLQDGGMTTGRAMMVSIAGSGLLVAAMIWMGPETRGRHFAALDEDER